MKQLQMNVDMDMLRVPCEMIDIMVRLPQSRSIKLTKSRIHQNGTYELLKVYRDPSSTAQAFINGEGCKIQGTLLQSADSNQFTIFLGYPEAVTELVLTNPDTVFNLSHKINHLSFGNPSICKAKLR
jgi:hypothetical protein